MKNGLTPSKYQKDIFEFVDKGHGNLVIEAVAGAGKTTTIINCLAFVPKGKRILFAAFNRDIVETLKEKVHDVRPDASVFTLHGLGFRILRRAMDDDIELDEFKYKTYIQKNLDELSGFDVKKMGYPFYSTYKANVEKLVDFGRYYLVETKTEMDRLCERYGITPLDNECDVALDVMEWGRESISTVDYTDMVYLPNALALNPYGYQYDYIFIDEVQDLNKAQRKLFQKCVKINTRFFACGDPNQCIYSFSGSDPESFRRLTEVSNTVKMPLSICYRCADAIVDNAKRFVPSIEKNGNGITGRIETDVPLRDVKDGDMVLCRNNAPLLELYEKFIRRGKKCHIIGKDIGENLKSMVADTGEKELYGDNGEGVFTSLYEKLVGLRDRVMKDNSVDEQTAFNSAKVLDLFDKIRALEVIGENCCTIQELNERIDTIFAEERTEGISLSTVHKAKGLENDRVFIACDSLMPSKSAHLPWEVEQEKNLQYVAYTRAKTYLGFLSEEEFKTRGGEHALADMRRIEDIVRITKENREHMMSGTVAYAPLVIMDSISRKKKARVPNGGVLGEKNEEPDTLFLIKRKTKSKRRK